MTKFRRWLQCLGGLAILGYIVWSFVTIRQLTSVVLQMVPALTYLAEHQNSFTLWDATEDRPVKYTLFAVYKLIERDENNSPLYGPLYVKETDEAELVDKYRKEIYARYMAKKRK